MFAPRPVAEIGGTPAESGVHLKVIPEPQRAPAEVRNAVVFAVQNRRRVAVDLLRANPEIAVDALVFGQSVVCEPGGDRLPDFAPCGGGVVHLVMAFVQQLVGVEIDRQSVQLHRLLPQKGTDSLIGGGHIVSA